MAIPRRVKMPGIIEKLKAWASHNLNFYRLHMLVFTFVPLFFSCIFYAANGHNKISYLDCLFNCMSAMCVTGLATINLSTATTFQQFLLFLQTILGSLVFVSIVMIYVRMQFFRQRFRHAIEEQRQRRASISLTRTISRFPASGANALRRRFTRNPTNAAHEAGPGQDEEDHVVPTPRQSRPPTPSAKKRKGPISKDMIKRIDGGGVGMVNPMGWYDGTPTPTPGNMSPATNRSLSPPPESIEVGSRDARENSPKVPVVRIPSVMSETTGSDDSKKPNSSANGSDELRSSPTMYKYGSDMARSVTAESVPGREASQQPSRIPYAATPVTEEAFPRSKTIAFDEPEDGMEHMLHPQNNPSMFPRMPTTDTRFPRMTTYASSGTQFPRTYSLRPTVSRKPDAKVTGFGGFPTPLRVITNLFHRAFPSASQKLTQTLTMPRTNTITGRASLDSQGREVPYISFSATVGRNSHFKDLTEEQMDELGGVEYRALKLLFYIVIAYWLFLPLAGATIIAPYIAAHGRYAEVFDSQPGRVQIAWFAFFQSYSGFTNLGMSLVDQSVVPFQKAYLMNAVVALLILFGNTCFPILLRFIIWVLYRLTPAESQYHESLKFLLDHPRRCFVYLFPSTTTWFLTIIVLVLTCIDFVSFMVLDIGTPSIDELAVGTRIAAALFQSVAVRAAGFVIVSMNNLAPAVKVLFVIMMYISVYPVAMSVRSTNVYEERSLGLFEEHEDSDDEDESMQGKQGATAVAKYLGWHARRQLAFDMWWIAGSLWLVCIIERAHLVNPENWEWMNIFNILFELTSAYGTVGLSLGVPFDNYSFCGAMRKLSKLVIIVVMLRGRHRGLPVAIDRAVMLPSELDAAHQAAQEERLRRSRSRRSMSMMSGDVMSQTGSAFPRTYSLSSNAPPGVVDMSGPLPAPSLAAQSPRMAPTSPRMPAQQMQSPIFGAQRPPGRRDSSPASFIRHARSQSGSSDMPPLTPSALSFALQQPMSERRAASFSTPAAGKGGASANPTGALTPVKEFSRRPTITDSAVVDEPEEISPRNT